jgi:hypothetical protein
MADVAWQEHLFQQQQSPFSRTIKEKMSEQQA